LCLCKTVDRWLLQIKARSECFKISVLVLCPTRQDCEYGLPVIETSG